MDYDFFVPVHGSGSDVSTLGDTIQWVRLFDPQTRQFLEAARGAPLFDRLMYCRDSGAVLLPLILTVRETTEYDEFEVFWKHHQRLPVSKIQLRFVKRDGMTHSPFGQADCISADLFMSRRRCDEFQDFVRTYLPDVCLNPGKQSM